MPTKCPQRRNKNAGKKTGKSKSAKYFQDNPEAREKKNDYNSEYHATEKRKDYRAKLNKANDESPNKKSQDKSHTTSGKLVNEDSKKNRARKPKGKGGWKKIG